ncbi:MAG: hypothetical protein IT455_03360 [Planctomycetes bacterium]|nr:hypothetical protein [Planctomycetota bacterium]
MIVRRRLPWLLLPAVLALDLPGQVALGALPALARARAERARPAQQKAMEPFWADLSLDYRNNQQFLDERINAVAALGDNVVPLLLEKLQPGQGGETARNLAGNCRRVLEKLDPGSFIDALAELVNGKNDIGRTEAIRLLGNADGPRAVPLLVALLDTTTGEDKRLVVRSLRLLKAASAAGKVVPMLGSNDRMVREDVLSYLVAAKAGQVVEVVVQALANEKETRLLPAYVEYFAAAVTENDVAARALLPLLDRERLDWNDTRRLLGALATIAPAGHQPTIARLTELLDSGDTSSLAVTAAVTLRALGDKQGVKKLKATLEDALRRRKREAPLYEQRANLLQATEEYAEAIADYEKILELNEGPAITRRAYVGLIRCEARRHKQANVLKNMRASGMTVQELEALGNDDPVLQELLQQEKVQAFLRVLAKEQQPK